MEKLGHNACGGWRFIRAAHAANERDSAPGTAGVNTLNDSTVTDGATSPESIGNRGEPDGSQSNLRGIRQNRCRLSLILYRFRQNRCRLSLILYRFRRNRCRSGLILCRFQQNRYRFWLILYRLQLIPFRFPCGRHDRCPGLHRFCTGPLRTGAISMREAQDTNRRRQKWDSPRLENSGFGHTRARSSARSVRMAFWT